MDIPELPNTDLWQPRASAAETLQTAFLKRCIAAERSILTRADEERRMNIDNYDSGVGVEDIIRDEIQKILPSRYSVNRGVVIDRDGRTSGDHEIVIFNDLWFPTVKAGATPASRRIYFPIEGVYAVGEIKQTLDFVTLDAALEKMVAAHRLTRPPTNARRLVENRESGSCKHGLSNPLYSFVLALALGDGVSFQAIIERFYDVNRKVRRDDVVRCLCVLRHGMVGWGYHDREIGGVSPALFMLEDLYEPLIPAYFQAEELGSTFFGLMGNLMLHLFHCVLAPEDIAAIYGTSSRAVKTPQAPKSRCTGPGPN